MPRKLVNILLLLVFIFRIFGSGFGDVPAKEFSRTSFQKHSSEKIPSRLLLFLSETESEESVENSNEIDADVHFFENLFSIVLKIIARETPQLPAFFTNSPYKLSFNILFHNLRL